MHQREFLFLARCWSGSSSRSCSDGGSPGSQSGPQPRRRSGGANACGRGKLGWRKATGGVGRGRCAASVGARKSGPGAGRLTARGRCAGVWAGSSAPEVEDGTGRGMCPRAGDLRGARAMWAIFRCSHGRSRWAAGVAGGHACHASSVPAARAA